MRDELRKHPLLLVADDDPTIRMMLRATMERSEFVVAEAENGVEALATIEALCPDVILLDVLMPELGGFETCARLRRIPSATRTPVLMLTGLDDLDSIDQAYRVGATDFITKPINWPILSYRVRYMLRASRAIEDLRQSEAKNKALLTAIPDSMVLLDKHGQSMDSNVTQGAILPVDSATTRGRRIPEALPVKVAQQLALHVKKALQTGTVQSFEYEVRLNRNKRTFETRVVAYLADAVLAITRDITTRQQVDE